MLFETRPLTAVHSCIASWVLYCWLPSLCSLSLHFKFINTGELNELNGFLNLFFVPPLVRGLSFVIGKGVSVAGSVGWLRAWVMCFPHLSV